jgi:hypothetical protein
MIVDVARRWQELLLMIRLLSCVDLVWNNRWTNVDDVWYHSINCVSKYEIDSMIVNCSTEKMSMILFSDCSSLCSIVTREKRRSVQFILLSSSEHNYTVYRTKSFAVEVNRSNDLYRQMSQSFMTRQYWTCHMNIYRMISMISMARIRTDSYRNLILSTSIRTKMYDGWISIRSVALNK